jgi:hypothetical protein
VPPLPPPPAATEHQRLSALLAARAAQVALTVRPTGPARVAAAVTRYQTAGAVLAETAVEAMLTQQNIDVQAEALLSSAAFTTETQRLLGMIEAVGDDDARFSRMVEAIVQDATRAAESVAVAVRPDVRFVRVLNLPSCARCAVLAGRVYRYSQGFLRHPNCDCVMLPCTVGTDLVQDPAELAKAGQIHGLSQADMQALADGADFGRVVNVRQKAAGLREAGQVLARDGRPSPAGIYQMTGDDRAKAVELLKRFGYIR